MNIMKNLPMLRQLKRLAIVIPTPGWTRRYPRLSRLEKWKMNAFCEKLLTATNHTVFAGPFSNMKLASNLALSADPRMVTGSYELEVQPIINEIICEAPGTVIDIGAAFGYYAVGFALKIADTKVIAFEAEEVPHWEQLGHLALLNNVADKIQLKGLCTCEELGKVCRENSFILSDCEGAEEDILKPDVVPALKSCKILVEVHEFLRPNLVATLVKRFARSHEIRIIDEVRRDSLDYRILKALPPHCRLMAIEEVKWVTAEDTSRQTTRLQFMLLTPKPAGNTRGSLIAESRVNALVGERPADPSLTTRQLSGETAGEPLSSTINRPAIAVVIPTYNRSKLIERAIESVLQQTFHPSQIIVVDDGSTDDTAELCAKYSSTILYVRQQNAGASAARNRGLGLSQSPWTAFLDSDDHWTPGHLERIAAAIEATSGKGRFYFSNMQLPGENWQETLWAKIGLNFTGPHLFIQDGTPWMLMAWQPCSLQCAVFNTNILKLSGAFDTRFCVREDTELFCRLGIGGEICLVNNVGCIQTADDRPENRLSEKFHTRAETYWQLEYLLYSRLLARFSELKPCFKRIIANHMATAYWRLSRLRWRSGHFLSSGALFIQAFAVQPAFLKEIIRPKTGNTAAQHLLANQLKLERVENIPAS